MLYSLYAIQHVFALHYSPSTLYSIVPRLLMYFTPNYWYRRTYSQDTEHLIYRTFTRMLNIYGEANSRMGYLYLSCIPKIKERIFHYF